MSETVADFMLTRLKQWGITRIYGFPGDGISGLVAALGRDDEIEFVQTRHEESAAFMAAAHAKWTGEVGCCLATSGPGAIHLLNGLYDAKLDHQPVVAIVGQQSRNALGGNYQQEVDLQSLFKDVAGEYVQTMMAPGQARHLIDRAIRIAQARRSVTCVIAPNDVQESPAVETPPHAHGTVHSGVGYQTPRLLPAEKDITAAADILNAGERVAILIGAGAAGAADQVARLADTLGTGVAKALLGKAAMPDDLPYVTGSIGLLGTKATDWMMRNCDTLLMIGSRFPYSEFLPQEGDVKAVQIDLDPTMMSIRYPMDVNLAGDAADTIEALLPHLKQKTDRDWRDKIEKNVQEWWDGVEKRSRESADPINPERLFWEASSRLPDRAILSADSGSSANWLARAIKIRKGMKASLSGTLATMCPGVPYAVAAKFCYPDRTAVAFVGDGAMQMLGITDLITVAKYWREWSDPRLVVCVLANQDLNQVTWELRAMANSPRVAKTQDVPDVDMAAYAEILGLNGIRVEKADDIGPAWERAFSADRPTVIHAVVDPDVPTLPPHITMDQAKSFMNAMLHGDTETAGIIKQTIKRVVDR
ncbi:thiamine pyrophosphate-requiring protein [Allgaiera indica]|uniref:Pyruvate dehydrogenase (Quinone) n=1 Tax=Allgaiera indica TaxID=765699 RepID=A0AAN4UT50_9RHOB|nr:thiamine pyrophosphate-requiring protein [Allgaiera indica]GHE04053.1 thiamine pyrophosphate-requiring protein [Allgaiera indica]SDX33512.1 pyruvate dehydrogenase (quinone) [Allgaiera indica]